MEDKYAEGYVDGYENVYENGIDEEYQDRLADSAVSEEENYDELKNDYNLLVKIEELTGYKFLYGDEINRKEMISAVVHLINLS